MDLPDNDPPELPDDAGDEAIEDEEEAILRDVDEILGLPPEIPGQFIEDEDIDDEDIDDGFKIGLEREAPYHPSGRVVFTGPEPWPEPVRAGEVLPRITHAITSHVRMDDHLALTAALWAMHTHRVAEATRTPRLVIHSSRVMSGKTTLLSVLSRLVLRPLTICDATPNSLVEAVAHRPTLLIDDGAALLQGSREARTLIRNGCCPGARLLRIGRGSRGPQVLELFTPIAVALDGDIPPLFAGRAIGIPLEPLPFGEAPGPLSPEALDNLSEMGRMIARWAKDEEGGPPSDLSAVALAKADLSAVALAKADPNWQPLLAIAAAIGDEWSTRTTEAMKRVGGVSATSELERLLSGIRTVIQDFRAGHCSFTGPDRKPIGDHDRIRTIDLIEQLCVAESGRWSEHGRNGQPVTPHALARILAAANIRPGLLRFHTGDENGPGVSFSDRGYLFTQFTQAFERYMPSGAMETV